MSQDKDDKELQDKTISQIYRQSRSEQSPIDVDEAILAAAKREAGSKPASLKKGMAGHYRWQSLFAIAATLVVAVGLVLHSDVWRRPGAAETPELTATYSDDYTSMDGSATEKESQNRPGDSWSREYAPIGAFDSLPENMDKQDRMVAEEPPAMRDSAPEKYNMVAMPEIKRTEEPASAPAKREVEPSYSQPNSIPAPREQQLAARQESTRLQKSRVERDTAPEKPASEAVSGREKSKPLTSPPKIIRSTAELKQALVPGARNSFVLEGYLVKEGGGAAMDPYHTFYFLAPGSEKMLVQIKKYPKGIRLSDYLTQQSFGIKLIVMYAHLYHFKGSSQYIMFIEKIARIDTGS